MSLCALRPPHLLRRTSHPSTPTTTPSRTFTTTQTPNANLIKRPLRPWLNDQFVILSDGSGYKQLTTSPKGIIRSTKDVRNHPLWNPSIHRLMDVEEDEAGKLRAFRERYGRGWDNRAQAEREREEEEKRRKEAGEDVGAAGESREVGEGAVSREEPADNLMDLLSAGYDNMAGRSGGKVKKNRPSAAAAEGAATPAAGETQGKKKKKK